MKPTDKEAQRAWEKYAKSVWFHTNKTYRPGMPTGRHGKQMQFAFKKGYHWTRYKQHPAVETDDGRWMIAFKKTKDGEIVGDIVKQFGDIVQPVMEDIVNKYLK